MNPEPIIAIVAAALFAYLLFTFVWHHLVGRKVTAISDGDGLKFALKYEPFKKPKPQKIRIYGIDAPELDQPFGPESKAALERLLLGRTVRITYDNDTHDRWACKVSLWLLDVSAWQVLTGWAHNYKEYGGRYGFHQWVAQRLHLGIWKHGRKGVIAPWDWRAMKEQRGKVVNFKASSKQKRKKK